MASEYYYYDENGKRLELFPDPDMYVVRFRRVGHADTQALQPKDLAFVKHQSEQVAYIPQYNMLVNRSHLPARKVKTRLRSLRSESTVETAEPVFHYAKEDQAPVLLNNLVTVVFADGVSDQDAKAFIEAVLSETGGAIKEPVGYVRPRVGYVISTNGAGGKMNALELSRAFFEKSANDPSVPKVEFCVPDLITRRRFRNWMARFLRTTRDAQGDDWTYKAEQWFLDKVGVFDAWSEDQSRGANVTVAICDDGVDVQHPEFLGRVVAEFDFESYVEDGSPKDPASNHGTACAGVAVAAGIAASGAAPRANLMAVRFPDTVGGIDEARMFEWMADNGADVINCSWGPESGVPQALAPTVRAAIRYCVTQGREGRGIPILWAAGNGDELVSDDGYATNPDVMAVAASTEQDTRAPYSEYGPEIFIAAPSSGDNTPAQRRIFTTDRLGASGYNPGSTGLGDATGSYVNDFGGTSAAAPLAAGVCALMLSANPELSVGQVRRILKETAVKIGDDYVDGHSPNFGYGRIDSAAAVRAAKDAQTTPIENSIEGPDKLREEDPPPTFSITLPTTRYYAVEVAARADLFDSAGAGDMRTDANFFASWQTGGLLNAPSFQLPDDAWARLRSADRLFYRMLSSSDQSAWSNVMVTPPSGAAGDDFSIEILRDEPGVVSPLTTEDEWSRNGAPPSFSIDVSVAPHYAIELAGAHEFFASETAGGGRTSSNYFASWHDYGLLSGATVTLPSAVWESLSGLARVYYRLWVSESSSEWRNSWTTVPSADHASAPWFSVTD